MPNTFFQPVILLIMATVTLLLAPQRSMAFGSIIGRVINCNSSSKLLSSYSIRSLSTIRGGNQRYSSTLVHTSASNNDLSNFSLPSSFDDDNRRTDVTSALLSVYSACRVTRHVQPTSSKHIGTISKQDSSPVTVGDFSSQAIALNILHSHYPNDMYISEESSTTLVADGGEDLLNKVIAAVNHDTNDDTKLDTQQILRSIDYGQGIDAENDKQQSSSPANRVWCLDPIDGTKGFLRGRIEGGQYCIALALIEDGEPVLSILGCPNLPLENTPATTTVPYGLWSEEEVQESESNSSMFSTSRGCLFVAVKDCGCYEIPLHVIEEYMLNKKDTNGKEWKKLQVTRNDGLTKPITQTKFCLGVERGFSDPKGTVLKIAEQINGKDSLTEDVDGIQDIKNCIRLDGQGKYGLLARGGDVECFLRLPKDGYVDYVWDVAAGYLVLREAGGEMTDVLGQPIDFSEIGGKERRAKLPDHVRGIFGSCGGVFHKALVESYSKVTR